MELILLFTNCVDISADRTQFRAPLISLGFVCCHVVLGFMCSHSWWFEVDFEKRLGLLLLFQLLGAGDFWIWI